MNFKENINMIIGINYNTDGTRYISTIIYHSRWNALQIENIANALTADCDEVYICPVDNTATPAINEVLRNGCRWQ